MPSCPCLSTGVEPAPGSGEPPAPVPPVPGGEPPDPANEPPADEPPDPDVPRAPDALALGLGSTGGAPGPAPPTEGTSPAVLGATGVGLEPPRFGGLLGPSGVLLGPALSGPTGVPGSFDGALDGGALLAETGAEGVAESRPPGTSPCDVDELTVELSEPVPPHAEAQSTRDSPSNVVLVMQSATMVERPRMDRRKRWS